MTKAAMFLDRDGVINEDLNYVHRIEDFRFIDGIFELCRQAKSAGMSIIVVTNQAGIGRGYYTEEQFHILSSWMKERFSHEGVEIDGIYFCPFHPVHGIGHYKIDSEDRKPKPGMILRARDEHDLALDKSVLIGDSERDIAAAKSAGVGTSVLFTDREFDMSHKPDMIVDSLYTAASLLFPASGKSLYGTQ